MVRNAIYSSLFTESATATFLLLPNWKGLDTNAYMQMLRKYPEHYMGTIPLSQTRTLDWKNVE